MPEPQVVSTLTGKEKPVPPVTEDVKKSSDARMSKIIQHAARFSGAVVPNSAEERERTRTEKAGGAEKPTNGASTSPAQEKPTPSGEEKPSAETAPKPTEPPKINWEEESKKHQSRADKFEGSLKEVQTKHDELVKQVDSLKIYKEQVDAFTADPVTFLMKNAPQLAQRLATSGDPIKAIESELTEYQKELDKQFFQTYGEDWRFNETESLKPGSPSFRYRLALDDKLLDIRSRYRNHVDEQRNKQAAAEKQIAEDKEKLKKDFGLTEEDIAKADEIFSKKPLTYYDLVKAIYFDAIIQKKIESLQPPAPVSRDITTGPKGGDGVVTPKTVLSDEGKKIAARFGKRMFTA